MLAADGYVFSSDGYGERPWPPDTVTHWFKRVRAVAGVDCTLRSLRHYNATQMLAAGIDLRTAAGRLGHAAGGAMTLKVYAHRTRPADQRACPDTPPAPVRTIRRSQTHRGADCRHSTRGPGHRRSSLSQQRRCAP